MFCTDVNNSFYVGKEAGTTETIFNKMDTVLQGNGISWNNCVGTCVDNASINMGIRNSIRTCALAKNPAIYFMGCPCHIVHDSYMYGGIRSRARGQQLREISHKIYKSWGFIEIYKIYGDLQIG